LGGVVLARVLALPGWLQAALGAAMLAAAGASVLGLYESVTWVDIPAHFLLNGLVAASLGTVLLRAGLLADPRTRRGRAGIALTTTTTGVALGVVWEIAEWVGFTYVDPSVYVYYGDTIGDLSAGGAGCLAAGLLVGGEAGGAAPTWAWSSPPGTTPPPSSGACARWHGRPSRRSRSSSSTTPRPTRRRTSPAGTAPGWWRSRGPASPWPRRPGTTPPAGTSSRGSTRTRCRRRTGWRRSPPPWPTRPGTR